MKGRKQSKSFDAALQSVSEYFILFLPEKITFPALQPWRNAMDMLKVTIISGPLMSSTSGIDWNMMKNSMLDILEDVTQAEAQREAIAIIDRAGDDLKKLHKQSFGSGKSWMQAESEWRGVLKELFMRALWKVQREEKKRRK